MLRGETWEIMDFKMMKQAIKLGKKKTKHANRKWLVVESRAMLHTPSNR